MNAPHEGVTITRPSSASTAVARLAVPMLTPYSSAIWRTLGTCSPGSHSPDRMRSRSAAWAPPIVRMNNATIGHLLAWELMEVDGTWRAWVSWVQESGGRPVHKVVDVAASGLQPLEASEAYEKVPRHVRGRDGSVLPWSGEII